MSLATDVSVPRNLALNKTGRDGNYKNKKKYNFSIINIQICLFQKISSYEVSERLFKSNITMLAISTQKGYFDNLILPA